MKILLRDFNVKVGRENAFKPTNGNKSLHHGSNDNGVRIVKFATPKNLFLNRTMFPHGDIHKYTWTSPVGKIHTQIVYILIDRRWHSSVLDVRSFREAGCNTDRDLVVAKVRERFAGDKQETRKFDFERFNLRRLNELEFRKLYQIEFSNRFSALEILSDKEDINRGWENIKEKIKNSTEGSLGLRELKQHKPWFDEKYLHFLDERKQTKMRWAQDPSQRNVDNLNNIRLQTSRHFRNKKKKHLKAKIEKLENNSKIKTIRTCIGTLFTLRRVTSLEII